MKITIDRSRVSKYLHHYSDSEIVSRYMQDQAETRHGDFDPHNCGETNATLLAEDAAAHFDLYETDGETIPEEVFEIALEVAEMYEEVH